MRMQLLTALGALAVGGTVLAATAQERPRREGRPDLATLQSELGLTAEQAAQMKKAWADGRKLAIRQRADLAIARIELEELMDAPVVDQKAIDAKVEAISELQAAGLKARTDQRLALRRTLSPEQREKMTKLTRQNRGARERRPDRGWRGRRPGADGPGQPLPPPAPEPER
jgi:Spy/CpxP family protein refolding chaperone